MSMFSAARMIVLLLCGTVLVLWSLPIKPTQSEMLVVGGNLRHTQMSPLTLSPATI